MWRYRCALHALVCPMFHSVHRHSVMVHRMLGNRFGTGGSSGHEYLRVSAARSRIFSDFFNLAGYYIPKVMLPTLPDQLQEQLGFSMQQSLSKSGSPVPLFAGSLGARPESFAPSAPSSGAQVPWAARALLMENFK